MSAADDAQDVPREDAGTLTPARTAQAASEPVTATEVVGLNGQPAKVPTGVWYAATDGSGNLETDGDGRPVRVRSPHRPPQVPLGG